MDLRRLPAASTIAGIALLISSSAFALPAMEVPVENLMFQADELKKSLNLNQNQQVLWQQVETKIRALLRARLTRREHLQSDLKAGLDDPRTELRDLSNRVDQEADATHQENKQLRELWLTMNDALDDTQRQRVLVLLADQLQRNPDQGHEHEQKSSRSGGESRGHGGRQKMGGGMGGGMQ